MTNIGRFAARLAEAGWLLAVVVVATFLNPFSDQVFESDKIGLLRIIAVITVAAWAVAVWECRLASAPARGDARQLTTTSLNAAARAVRQTPFLFVVGLLLLSHLLSTVTSVAPRVSWWGSYERAQGTYTFLAYLALFLAVATLLRRPTQLERLITVLLITSIPVALYAVFQRFGITLLQFTQSGIEARVISTLGNAIFLAAYLVMLVPLTAWRLFDAFNRPGADRSAPAGFLYAGLLCLQLAAIVFTQSRGPLLALLAEGFVLLLLVAVLLQRRWAVAGVAVVTTLIVFIAVVSSGAIEWPTVPALPYLARFTDILNSAEVRSRMLAWDTTLEAISASPTRVLLGYGAETMKPILTRYMPAELWVLQGGGRYGTFDRAHNAVFDTLYGRGVVGVLIYLALYALVFYQSLRWLGLITDRSEAVAFSALLGGGAVAGLIGSWVGRGDLVLVGVLVTAGMVAGLVVYLVVVLVRRRDTAHTVDAQGLLIAALLAAVVGHFVETQTGIAIAATRTYLWLYLGLMLVVGTGRLAAPAQRSSTQPVANARSRRGRRDRRAGPAVRRWPPNLGPVVALGLVVAFALGTLVYAFIHGFNMPGSRWPVQLLLWLTWLFAGAMILAERRRLGAGDSSLLDDGLKFAAASLVWLLPFAALHRLNAQTLEQLDRTYLFFLLWSALTFVGVAAALYRPRAAPTARAVGLRHVAYAALVLLAATLVWQTDVRRVRADIYEKVAKTGMSAGLSDRALAYFERAVATQPHQAQYYIFLGGAYVERARLLAQPAERQAWIRRAEETFEQGQALAPYNSDHPRQLGLLYAMWADWVEDDVVRQQRLQRALDYYQRALELDPHNPDLRLGLADVYLTLGRTAAAQAAYSQLIETGASSHLARAYAGRGDALLMAGELESAAEAYRRAVHAGQDSQQMLQARAQAVTGAPESVVPRERLALAYAAADQRDAALEELNVALKMASTDSQRAEVTRLRALIEE